MRFQSIALSAIAVFSAATYAQDASQVSALLSDIESYADSLSANPDIISLVELPPTALASLLAFRTELVGLVTLQPGQVSTAIAALPTEIQSFASSAVGAVQSIISKDIGTSTKGLAALETSLAELAASVTSITLSSGTATATATGSKASATGSGANKDVLGMGLLAGSLMGVMGVMVAL